jgi:hypothetical protein
VRFNRPRATFNLLLVSLTFACSTPRPDAPLSGNGGPAGPTELNGSGGPTGATVASQPGAAPQPGLPTAAPLPPQPAQASHSCPTFDERSSAATGDYTAWAGCSCTPDAQRRRDRKHCGMFPCAEQGCYVQPCKADSDCAIGLCANYLGRPRGYCVTDDPK